MSQMVNRREFLERTTMGAVAVTLFKPQVAPGEPAIYTSLAPWAVARGVGWPEQAQLAARVGYGGIDWAWQGARQAGADSTRALLTQLNIKPSIVNLPGMSPFTGDDDAFKARLPQLDEDAAFCAAIGCRNFQLVLQATTPNGQSKDERWKFVRDRLAAVSEVITKHGVRLGLEFLGPLQFRMGRGGGGGRGRPGGAAPDPAAPPAPPVVFVYTLTETVKLCQEAGPNLGATLDAWHWYHSGGTVEDILATDKSRIIHIHVSDARQMAPEDVRDDMRLLPGEGVINLVGFFQALKKIGWTGGVACETIGARIPNDMPPEESAKLGLDTTTAVLKKAGLL